jgi:hypothetical protein
MSGALANGSKVIAALFSADYCAEVHCAVPMLSWGHLQSWYLPRLSARIEPMV